MINQPNQPKFRFLKKKALTGTELLTPEGAAKTAEAVTNGEKAERRRELERGGGSEEEVGTRHGLSDEVCNGSRGMGRELDREIEPMIAYPLFLTDPKAKKTIFVFVRETKG